MNGAFFGLPPRQELARRRLDDLGRNPPQVLVLEGGTAPEREAAALYYAAALNCARLLEDPTRQSPCGACPACVQVRERTYMDLLYLDGAEQSIKVDDIREVRQKVGEPPRGPGRRLVALTEAQGLTPQAANALLKSMEEPRPGNCFVLLAPQRERLLPTLVSRSWVLTLAWPEPSSAQCPSGEGPEAPFMDALERFWHTGHGLFGLTGSKGKLTRPVAQQVVLALSKELAQALAGRPCSRLGAFFAERLGVEGLRALDLLLEAAQEALINMANPALVLERLAVRVWLLSR
ncbi:DNA polymerase III subunit gamma/tau [Fundidesulfovibrio magnetotacticus]|uniref:DNA polymerase III subunit gamma/tau n=1 Tax=Fundidesulfovibrio magnetotacticus TaxID=2730080 RepID=A0A6V8LW22_9BACT|nr:DNA polymerase III subunit delta' [Fundidesulfovibrio magnetotacticus]GFK94801.1 DNA polymerase III subunit gamma/tau [Fundidesulfovibrio magnetotacticus]